MFLGIYANFLNGFIHSNGLVHKSKKNCILARWKSQTWLTKEKKAKFQLNFFKICIPIQDAAT